MVLKIYIWIVLDFIYWICLFGDIVIDLRKVNKSYSWPTFVI